LPDVDSDRIEREVKVKKKPPVLGFVHAVAGTVRLSSA
jgi:hypothetical protein